MAQTDFSNQETQVMEAWYTLHSKPNAEYQVATTLMQHGIETYLPEIEVAKKQGRRHKKPFFPCYLFCLIDLKTVDLGNVRWVPGLRRIVTFDDQPIPVPDEVIDLVRYKLGEIETRGGFPNHSFKRGQMVRITQGAFQGMVAIFDEPTSPSERVQVLLDILGGTNRVQVKVADLETASAQAGSPTPKRPRRMRGRGRQPRHKYHPSS
jgi:transcription elongation factor/antiterminator RfaH